MSFLTSRGACVKVLYCIALARRNAPLALLPAVSKSPLGFGLCSSLPLLIKIATSGGVAMICFPLDRRALCAADLDVAFPRVGPAAHLQHQIAGARRLRLPQQAQTRLTGQAAPLAVVAGEARAGRVRPRILPPA